MARALLVIEDGHEYEEFARLFLAGAFARIDAAHTGREALAMAAAADAFLIDLRFERAVPEDLLGDLGATAARLFGGDEGRALRWLIEQQGTLVLAALRDAGHGQPAVFVQDFPPRRLTNLRRLYGSVHAVPGFDAGALRRAFQATAAEGA